jgi:hypothetical protein
VEVNTSRSYHNINTQWMGEIDDYNRRENIKGMEKLKEYLLCEDKTSSV